jgi:hypothetical protein
MLDHMLITRNLLAYYRAAALVMGLGDNDEHDVVLVDERGTGDGHRLAFRSPGSDDDLEGAVGRT